MDFINRFVHPGKNLRIFLAFNLFYMIKLYYYTYWNYAYFLVRKSVTKDCTGGGYLPCRKLSNWATPYFSFFARESLSSSIGEYT